MIDWPLALSTISHALKLAQDLRGVEKELSHAELKLKVADLTSALADIKLTLSEGRVESAEKDAEIARLKTLHRRLVDDTIELRGHRYRKSNREQGQPAGSPFCAACLAKNGLLIETVRTLEVGRPLKCPSCGANYGDLHSFSG
jgi:hypothetical protein